MASDNASVEEQGLLAEFEASQRKRNMIGMVVAGLVIAGFLGLKVYQRYLAHEASKPVVIETKLLAPKI